MGLTPKQEKFCQCIVSGMSGKDSYIEAYDSKGSAQNAYNEASKLLIREDIQARLAILRKPLAEAAATTALSEREKKRAVLWQIIQNGDDNAKCRALDILNKMDAEYININKNIDDTSTALQGIDKDMLIKLSAGM